MANKTSEQNQDRIIELYESGFSISKIKQDLKISKPTISKILKKNGIEIRQINYQYIKIDNKKLNQDYNDGMSTYELAIKYGCSDETIRKRIHKIRPERDRNTRTEQSKQKIANSCKKLWDNPEYVNKQKRGHTKFLDSDASTKCTKENYQKTLGKWIKTDKAKETISKISKKNWQDKDENLKKQHADKAKENAAKRNSKTFELRKQNFLRAAAEVHKNQYDYSCVEYVNMTTKIEILCPKHKSFWQIPSVHKAGHGCPKCADKSLNTQEFIERANTIHNNSYDYSKTNYKTSKSKVEIICFKCGMFEQTANKHLNGHGCTKCQVVVSTPHQKVLDLIPKNIRTLNNDRTALDGIELDVFIPKYALGIEIHGCYWHSCKDNNRNRHSRYKNLHALKAETAEQNDIKLCQFWDYEIQNKPELIQSMIRNKLGLSKKIYARKCEIKKLTNKEARSFFDQSHLQGHRAASLIYALELGKEIQCAVSFSKHNKHEWEIIRYACRRNTSIIGGFARLFKKFQKDLKPKTVLTFADRRFSVGNLYTQNNFQLINNTKPGYFYTKGTSILSRQKCQKHKLDKLLGNSYEEKLSEKENMLKNGFGRVYDAGHKKMLWQSS